MKEKTRSEKDSLGSYEVPFDAYYGIHTSRSITNFPISRLRQHPSMVTAVIQIKKAAAFVHKEDGRLKQDKANAIIQACDEILTGKFLDQFIVDVFQMGAGTSFHMNCNEVIANRAEEIMGGRKGEYRLVHPFDDVNMGQSTNDVFPTGMRLAIYGLLQAHLNPALESMEGSFLTKAAEFKDIIKSGRTHLQDAAPITLGQEFKAYGKTIQACRNSLQQASLSLLELGIGGTAVGTGINTTPEFADNMVKILSELTGFDLEKSEDQRESMQSMRPMLEVSAALRTLAVELTRIANDLRLLASGPKTGFAEIVLAPVAPGSSIMPGKVNPSMLEMLNMVCYQVIGCDLTVVGAAQAGQLELNVMMPVIAYNLCFMIEILSNALKEVSFRCIDLITANEQACREFAERSMGLATALTPYIGYARASEVAKQALEQGKTLTEVVLEKKLLSFQELEEILKPDNLTSPNIKIRSKT